MATNAEKLAEARDALHKLSIGRLARVVVDQNGERVEFTSANRDALRAYIADLEGLVNATTPVCGPIRFTFG